MSCTPTGLTEQEAAHVSSVLHEGEQVVLLAAPRVDLTAGQTAAQLIPGVMLACPLVHAAIVLGGDCWVILLFGLPFWLVAIVLLISPLWQRLRMARSRYLLTNRRAVVMENSFFRRPRTVSFPLRENLVLKVEARADGYGDVIFAWERGWQPGIHVYKPVRPVGFIMVPQPERVAHMIAEQVAAVPEGEELPEVEGVQPLPLDRKGRPRAYTVARVMMMWMGCAGCAVAYLLLLKGVSYLREDHQVMVSYTYYRHSPEVIREERNVRAGMGFTLFSSMFFLVGASMIAAGVIPKQSS